MGIYAGVNGVVRQIEGLDIGRQNLINHMNVCKAGVGGVVRDLMGLLEQVSYVLIEPDTVLTYEVNSNGTIADGGVYEYGLDAINKYGSVSITDNQIQVTCSTRRRCIELMSEFYVVYKDGHRTPFRTVLNQFSNASFTLSVTGYEYFNNDGWYFNHCLGTPVLDAYVSGSETKTITITEAGSNISDIEASMKYGGTCRSRQTFNSLTINGQKVPIKIISELS